MFGNRMWLVLMCLTGQQTFAQEMCQVPGVSGSCGIAPFFQSEASNDKTGHTCEKLRGSTYFYGQCIDGKLHGLIGLTQAADSRWGRSKKQLLLQVLSGVPQNVGLSYTNVVASVLEFANGQEASSAGCINWHAKWDHRKSYSPCTQAAELFGSQALERSFAQQMLAGKADLTTLNVSIDKATQSVPTERDDPKARGRSARVR